LEVKVYVPDEIEHFVLRMELVINGRFLTQRVTGVQRYARELIRALDDIFDQDSGCQITVMSPRLSGRPPSWRNIALHEVGFLQGHAWEQIELPWHARGKILFCPANTAPAISLLGAASLIVTVHDLSYKYFPEAYRTLFRLWYGFLVPLILKRAGTVITVSESERRAIIERYPGVASRLHVTENGGLPFEASTNVTNIDPGGGGYILYVGSLSKRKNFQRLLEVACRLARERGFRFVFVGDTSKTLTTVRTQIPDDVSSLITFVGAVDEPAVLVSLYEKAACFLFPSLYESSGLPPIEAMGCGCPVVTSDLPALRERCGDAAIYCDPHDVDSIVAKTIGVMDDAALRQRLQALGRQRAAMFTWDRCARQTLKLIYAASCKHV
jgi:glycosyltransferase involved in cell wall biosynthesis